MPLWTPLDLGAKLKTWWNADDHGTANMTDDGSGLISSWKDRVSAVNVTAATTARPTWAATSFNSAYQGLTFNGTANAMTTTTLTALPTGAVEGEIWFVGSWVTSAGTVAAVSYGGTGATSQRVIHKIAAGEVVRITDGTTTVAMVSGIGNHIVGGIFNTTSMSGRMNGTAYGPSGAITLATGTTRLRIGANTANTAAQFHNRVVRHVIVTTLLTVAEREQLEGWFAHNSGLTANLPGGHPYKTTAPTTPSTGTLAVIETGSDIAAFSEYDADALALFARWTTVGATPSTSDKQRAQERITALKSAGLWTGIQVLQCYDAHASAAALTNWKSPGTHDATLIGAPTFTAYEGFATNGSSSAVAAFNPAGLLAQNDFHVGLWLTDTAGSATSHFGWYDGTDGITLNCRDTSNQIIVRASVTDANTGTVTGITTAAGLTAMNRSGANAIQVYRDGIVKTVSNSTAASAALNSATLNIGQPSGSFSVTHPLFLVAGVSLNAGQHASLYSTLESFTGLPEITGTLAVIESGSDTATLAGTVSVSGTLVIAETGADSAALGGAVRIGGTLAVTEVGPDTAALVGTVAAAATLAATEVGADTAAFTGSVAAIAGITATLAVIESGEDIAAFTGTVAVLAGRTATLAITETGADSAAFSISSAITGTLAAVEFGSDTAEIILRTRGVEANIGLIGSLAPAASLSGSANATLLSGSLQSKASLRGSVSLSTRLQARWPGDYLRGRV